MAVQEQNGNGNGNGVDGTGGEPPKWDFRLDRWGLEIRAGRHLQLHVSLAMLLWLIGLTAGWSVFQWGSTPPLP
ncbi:MULTISPECIES: hypothetical protein [unclassified Streptomyces]|uniref:hypothetical protein n=1 Tax=unclassified Streptomyces TaxID=2593676 RepID=UPI00030EA942|nr:MULTISPECIES: hypothetical protein [unclassified Streptomyces]MYX43050.1 hypothetical protein [Streptomyces sp. SID89]NED33221.1 hypothetical protein [Streptomyces sp. SID8499]